MADTSNRLAGTAFLSVDGVSYALVGDFEYDTGLVERKTEAGMDGIHGYSEAPHAPGVSGVLRDTGGLTVADFNAMTNVTVVIELANGKTIIARNQWVVEDNRVKSTDATFPVKWEGVQGSVSEN